MPNNQPRAISITLLIIGVIIFLVMAGIPAVYTLIISTRQYSPIHGVFGSPSVGLEHYREFTGSFFFSRLFANSLVLSLVPSILAVIIALPTAGVVGAMARGRGRSFATVALLLPAFIPDIVLAFLTVSILPSQTLASAQSFRLVAILLSAIRPAAICAFVGACAAGIFKDRGRSVFFGAAIGVFVGIAVSLVRFLTTNAELLLLLYNPLVFSTADTFDTYMFRQGMHNMQLSHASAIWVFRTFFQMIMAAVVSVIVFFCVKAGLQDCQVEGQAGGHGVQAGLVPGIIGALTLVVGLLLPLGYSGTDSMDLLSSAIGSSLITTAISTVLFSILLFMLAAGLSVNIKNAAVLALILILVSIANNFMGEFLSYRTMGLTNTHFAVAFANAANIAFVLPLAYLARLRNPSATSANKLIRSMAPYFVAFIGLFIAMAWGNSYSQMIHLSQMTLFGAPMLLRATAFQFGGDVSSAGVIIAVTLPILALAAITTFAFTMADSVNE